MKTDLIELKKIIDNIPNNKEKRKQRQISKSKNGINQKKNLC